MSPTKKNDNQITAVGVIIPVDWDEKGAPSAFAVSTYNEQEYLLDSRTDAGRRLTEMAHRKIKVTGTLGSMVNNRRLIRVKRFETI